LHDEHGRRRRLHDEREALVGVRGDHDRDRQARLHLLRLRVERLAELHDVQAALSERRTDRRARVRLAGGYLQLDESDDFLRHEKLLIWVQADAFSSVLPGSTTNQAFSTCEKSSSTGVERPKMVTDTRS